MSDKEREYRLKLAKAMQERSAAMHEFTKAKTEITNYQSLTSTLRSNVAAIQEENFDLKAQLGMIEAEKTHEMRQMKNEKEKEVCCSDTYACICYLSMHLTLRR